LLQPARVGFDWREIGSDGQGDLDVFFLRAVLDRFNRGIHDRPKSHRMNIELPSADRFSMVHMYHGHGFWWAPEDARLKHQVHLKRDAQ
jgi:hypothetical protein